MITYAPHTQYSIHVFLDGKLVGGICEIFDTVAGQKIRQYQYWPRGSRSEGGEKFPTLATCKRSLEDL